MNAMTETPQAVSRSDMYQIDTYDARALISKGVQACILLDDQAYYLRITRAGKLILTK